MEKWASDRTDMREEIQPYKVTFVCSRETLQRETMEQIYASARALCLFWGERGLGSVDVERSG